MFQNVIDLVEKLRRDFSSLDNSVRQGFKGQESLGHELATLRSEVGKSASEAAIQPGKRVDISGDVSRLTSVVGDLKQKMLETERNVSLVLTELNQRKKPEVNSNKGTSDNKFLDLDKLSSELKDLKGKVSILEGNTFSGAVKNAESAVTPLPSKPLTQEEKEAVHDVAVLTGVVDSVVKELRQIQGQLNELKQQQSSKFSVIQENLIKDVGQLRESLTRMKQNNLVTRIDDLESSLVRMKKVLPPELRLVVNSTAAHQGHVVHDLADLTSFVSGLSGGLANLQKQVSTLKTGVELTSASQGQRLNNSTERENRALADLTSLSSKLSALSLEVKSINLKQLSFEFDRKIDSTKIEMRREIDDLKKSYSSLKQATNKYEVDHTRLNVTTEEEKVAIHDLAALANVVSMISKEVGEVKNKSATIGSLRDQLAAYKDLVGKMKEEVDDMKKTIYVLKLVSDVVESDHAQLNYTFSKEKTVVKNLESVTRIISVLSADLLSTKEAIARVRSKTEAAADDCSKLRNEMKSQTSDFSASVSRIRNDVSKLNTTADKERNVAAALKDVVSELSKDVGDLKGAKLAEQKSEFQTQKKQLQLLRDVLDGTRNEVEELKKTVYVLKLESDVFSADHRQLNYTVNKEKTIVHDLAALTSFVALLGTDLQRLKESTSLERNNLTEAMRACRERCHSLQQRMVTIENDVSKNLKHETGEFESLKSTKDRLKSSFEDLRKEFEQLKVLQVEKVSLQQRLQQMENFAAESKRSMAAVGEMAAGLAEVKSNLKSTVDHQVKAVHDVALLSSVVDALRSSLVASTNNLTKLSEATPKPQFFESLMSVVQTSDAQVLNELNRFKEATRDRQQKFEKDFAAVVRIVEDLKAKNAQQAKEFDDHGHFKRRIDELSNKLSELQRAFEKKTPVTTAALQNAPVDNYPSIEVSKKLKDFEMALTDLKQKDFNFSKEIVSLKNFFETLTNKTLTGSEMTELKSHYEATRDHQLKAVHDVAAIAGIVEGLKTEVQECSRNVKQVGSDLVPIKMKFDLLDVKTPDVMKPDEGHLMNRSSEHYKGLWHKLEELESAVRSLQPRAAELAALPAAMNDLKKHFEATRDHQTKAVSDLASLVAVVEALKSDVGYFKQTIDKLAPSPVHSPPIAPPAPAAFVQRNEADNFKVISGKIAEIESLVAVLKSRDIDLGSLSKELFNLKQHYESTKDHQLKAVHDLASLFSVVERLKVDIQSFKKSSDYSNQVAQNVTTLANAVDSLKNDLNRLQSAKQTDTINYNSPKPVSSDSFLTQKLKEIETSLSHIKSKEVEMSNEFNSLKQNLHSSQGDQLKTQHDVTSMARALQGLKDDVIGFKRSFNESLKEISSLRNVVQTRKNDSSRDQGLAEVGNGRRIEEVEKQVSNLKSKLAEVSMVTVDVDNLKKLLHSTRDHQLKAVHDVTALANYVEALKQQVLGSRPGTNASTASNNEDYYLRGINALTERIASVEKLQSSSQDKTQLLEERISDLKQRFQQLQNLSNSSTSVLSSNYLAENFEGIKREWDKLKQSKMSEISAETTKLEMTNLSDKLSQLEQNFGKVVNEQRQRDENLNSMRYEILTLKSRTQPQPVNQNAHDALRRFVDALAGDVAALKSAKESVTSAKTVTSTPSRSSGDAKDDYLHRNATNTSGCCSKFDVVASRLSDVETKVDVCGKETRLMVGDLSTLTNLVAVMKSDLLHLQSSRSSGSDQARPEENKSVQFELQLRDLKSGSMTRKSDPSDKVFSDNDFDRLVRNVTEERSRIEAVFNSIRSGKSTEETRAKLKELSGVVDRSVTSSLFLDFSTSGFLDLSQLGKAKAYRKTNHNLSSKAYIPIQGTSARSTYTRDNYYFIQLFHVLDTNSTAR